MNTNRASWLNPGNISAGTPARLTEDFVTFLSIPRQMPQEYLKVAWTTSGHILSNALFSVMRSCDAIYCEVLTDK
jgi:hypothetical protein